MSLEGYKHFRGFLCLFLLIFDFFFSAFNPTGNNMSVNTKDENAGDDPCLVVEIATDSWHFSRSALDSVSQKE